jgi:hypothetical protein
LLQNITNIDVEDNLSHLVLDKEGIVPRPGVWSSPLNLPLPKTQPRLSLPTLKNACTVEELERGLIANRPPPGLSKPQTQQQQKKSEVSVLFEALSVNEKFQVNGLATPSYPPGLGIHGTHPMVLPNLRVPHPQYIQPNRLLLSKYIILSIYLYIIYDKCAYRIIKKKKKGHAAKNVDA